MFVSGVNTTFKESSDAPKPGHLTDESQFHTILFNDDEFEKMRDALRDRLLRLTKAAQVREIHAKNYEDKVANWKRVHTTLPGLRADPVDRENLPPAPEGTELCRWKFAFRELRPRRKGEPPIPTVITMRDGRTRLATPLEEMKRPWSKRPQTFDAIAGLNRLTKYFDPDQDDDKAKAISHADRLRREGLLREYKLLKRK